jgi:hypothetical protein
MKAAELVGIDRTTHNKWMNSKAYREAFYNAAADYCDNLLLETERRIFQGYTKPMQHKGQPTVRTVQLDDEVLPRLVQNFACTSPYILNPR